jgi:hypothetical protein
MCKIGKIVCGRIGARPEPYTYYVHVHYYSTSKISMYVCWVETCGIPSSQVSQGFGEAEPEEPVVCLGARKCHTLHPGQPQSGDRPVFMMMVISGRLRSPCGGLEAA